MFRRHPVLSSLTALYLIAVALMTLGPSGIVDRGDRALRRLARALGELPATGWVTFGGLEFVTNVLMFVPVGLFLLLLLGRRLWWLGMLCGIALTCVIEYVQRYMPDRVSDVRDIAANSIGTLLGIVLALIITSVELRRRRRRAPAAA